jgi:hypothetical protein
MAERNYIALGDMKTLAEARERILRVKANIKYKIAYNKLKVSPSSFKFKINKEERDFMGNKKLYPYYLYVQTPSDKYNWMFLA